jgi:hypothetical protein
MKASFPISRNGVWHFVPAISERGMTNHVHHPLSRLRQSSGQTGKSYPDLLPHEASRWISTRVPPSVLWHNRQTESRLVLRPKQRNRRGDFEAQITKPELPVLRPKSGNPPPPWFWCSTNKPTASFEAKPGETVATSFQAKLEKTVATGFEAKPAKTVAVGFEAKPLEIIATGFEVKLVKTIRVVLRPNHSQTVAIGFEAQTDEKPSQWFWGQTTDKPSTLVLRLDQETRAPSLHVPGADRTWRHPTSWPPGHWVPDLCDHLPVLCTRSPTPATVLIDARHATPATCTLRDKQTQFSKRNKDKRKTKQTIPYSNSNLTKSMTHHNQIKKLTT